MTDGEEFLLVGGLIVAGGVLAAAWGAAVSAAARTGGRNAPGRRLLLAAGLCGLAAGTVPVAVFLLVQSFGDGVPPASVRLAVPALMVLCLLGAAAAPVLALLALLRGWWAWEDGTAPGDVAGRADLSDADLFDDVGGPA